MKKTLIKIISSNYTSNQYSKLEQYALFILLVKIKKEEPLSKQEKDLIIDGFLANYLFFDRESGEPIENTKEIENVIDFIIQSKNI